MNIPNPKFDLFETVTIVDYIENKKGMVSRRLYDIDNNKYIYDVLLKHDNKYEMGYFEENQLKKPEQ
jgi:hypothetical protein